MGQSSTFRFQLGKKVHHVASPGTLFYISERAIIESPQALVKKYVVRQILGVDDPGGPGVSVQLMEMMEHELVAAK